MAFAKTVEGTAKLFGENAAVSALKQGEEKGKSDYEDAIDSEDVMVECKEMIASRLLPRQSRHITTLTNLQDQL